MVDRVLGVLPAAGLVVGLALAAGAAGAQSAGGGAHLSADSVIEALIDTVDMGSTRAICIGTPEECARPPRGVDMLVGFDFDSDVLTPDARGNLGVFAAAMNDDRLEIVSFRIEGHTDALGRPDYNADLSQRRAEAVRGFLVTMGVDPTRLEVEGFGATLPRTDDPADPENRRVELRAVLR